jgi:hypothetical protein
VSLTVQENARRLGAQRWVALRLFETLGGWLATTPEPTVKAMFATHCHHHAWHAELLHARLPNLNGAGVAGFTAPPPDGPLAAEVDALAQAATTADRLHAVYGVLLPALIAECTAHLEATNAITDGPTARVLTLVQRDLVDHLREGLA